MSILFRPRRNLPINRTRAFSTCPRHGVSLQLDKNDQEAVKDLVPEYPYGRNQWYQQSNLGLYGGQRIRFGNNVGETFGVKTRRKWRPNVRTKKLWSHALQGSVQVRVTTRTLRTIDKLGGLDEYLLGEKEARIRELGETGWWLRWAIMQTPVIKKRFALEKEKLGLNAIQANAEVSTLESAADVELVEEGTSEQALEEQSTTRSKPARIRFRTGRRKHLTLTPAGWRRARPTYKLGLTKRYSQDVNDAVEAQVKKLTEAIAKEEGNAVYKDYIADELRPEIRRRIRRLRTPWYQAQKETTIEAERERRASVKRERRARRNAREQKNIVKLSETLEQTAV